MQYEPIKRSLGRFITKSLFLRKTLYFLLDLLLLRTWHVKKALRGIGKHLPADASVLDAGCGFGQYSWRMSRMNPGWKIKGVDIDKDQIEDCNTFFKKTGLSGKVSFQTCDLTTLSDLNCYNLIISVDVMEHIEKDVLVLNNFYRSLKNGGILLISTPSDKGGSDVHDGEDESFIDEHVRGGYGLNEITEKLSAAGFISVDVRYTYGIPGSIAWRLSMKYPIKMLNLSYMFFIVLPFYYVIFFPVSLILNIFDLCLTHKTGTGLLVTARKE
ncbi:MAG TPA: class I SAM-dependent methyltransferase [Bacteroidales bacterium]|nr:class I SAM-dependent methyltransferase [Bacteroidales bacterium]HPT20389.1 class I SAM-dependent methyltransferase [Bacteroidales bacterium]